MKKTLNINETRFGRRRRLVAHLQIRKLCSLVSKR
jgi:hypothetical protein